MFTMIMLFVLVLYAHETVSFVRLFRFDFARFARVTDFSPTIFHFLTCSPCFMLTSSFYLSFYYNRN